MYRVACFLHFTTNEKYDYRVVAINTLSPSKTKSGILISHFNAPVNIHARYFLCVMVLKLLHSDQRRVTI